MTTEETVVASAEHQKGTLRADFPSTARSVPKSPKRKPARGNHILLFASGYYDQILKSRKSI